jgi:hypothetical protein
MPTVPIGPWAPDAYDLNSSLAGEAKGVLPGGNAYHPWPQLIAASAALDSACLGGIAARKSDGNFVTIAGTASKLYQYATSTSWNDVSGTAYNVPSGEYWSMTQYGSVVYATNGSDGLQAMDVDSGSAFDAASGSPPIGRIVKTVGDFLMLGRTTDYPTGIEWSALNDATFWEHGTRSSDFQLFPDGGFVTGITTLEAGLIFQENAIRRFAQTADQSVFSFAKVEDAQGLVASQSLVTRGTTSFYFGRNGFRRIGPDTGYVSQPIGLEVVDRWFQDTIDMTRLTAIQGVADPLKPRVFWLAPSQGNSSSILDVLVCYDDGLKQWTHADVSASILFATATPGISMDDLDSIYPNLDAMTITLDSPTFMGGVPYVGAFNGDFKLAYFNGSPMAAIAQTAEFQPIPGRRTFVRGFRPQTDAVNAQGRIASRERLQVAPTWTTAADMNDQGLVPQRASGRYMRAEVSIAAGEHWTSLQGVDVDDDDLVPDGAR